MRALIALAAVGLIARPVVPKADEPAPPADPVRVAQAPPPSGARPAPAPARAAPAPSRQGAPSPPPGSAAVRPAPPPHVGTVGPAVRPAPPPGTRYGPSYGYPHRGYPYGPYYPHRPYYYPSYPYYPYSHYPYYPYSYYPYYPYWAFGVGIGVGFGLGWGWGTYPYYPYYPSYSYYPGYPGYPYSPDYPPYGYYPPSSPYPPSAYAPPSGPPVRLTSVVSFQGGAYSGAGAGAFALGVDGRRFGFQGSIGGVGEDKLRGVPVAVPTSDEPIVGWGVAHATWSVLAADRYRLRLEGGASMLYMPDSNALAGQPYAGTIAIGPSLGVSGHARIVGPFGIEGHARLTPLPVQVADLRAAAALHFGPVAITGGWRAVDVSGDGHDGPKLRYSGPELGLSLGF